MMNIGDRVSEKVRDWTKGIVVDVVFPNAKPSAIIRVYWHAGRHAGDITDVAENLLTPAIW